MKKKQRTMTVCFRCASVLFVAILISSCSPGRLFGPTLTPTFTVTFTPTITVTPTATPTFTSTATLIPTLTVEEAIRDILEIACQGKPATSSVVGTSTEQPGVRLCNDSSELLLPDNWQATTPDALRYVVAVSSTQVASGSCIYSSTGGIITTVQLFKPIETIFIYDSITGALINQRDVHGSNSACFEYVFTTPTDQYGFSPTQDEMQEAMMDLLSPLLPSPKFIPTATPIPIPQCSPSFTLKGNTSEVIGFSFSQDGTLLETRYNDDMMKLWDVTSGREVLTIDYARSYIFSPDGKMLAGLAGDRVVQLLNVASGSKIRTLEIREIGDVHKLAFLSDGTLVAFGDFAMEFWDVVSGNEVRTLELEGFYDNVALSPNGKMMALLERGNGTATYILKLLDMANGTEVRTLLEGNQNDGEFSIAFSPDGKWLVTEQVRDSRVKLWDVASGSEVRTLDINDGDDIVFSPDGTLLALVSQNEVKLWSMASGSEVRTLDINDAGYYGVYFSPDGTLLASESQNEVKLWSVTSGSEVRTLNINDVYGVVFSPDGTLLASASSYDAWNQPVTVWDVSSGSQVCVPKGDSFSIFSFSPDGTLLVTGTIDGIVSLWEVNRP